MEDINSVIPGLHDVVHSTTKVLALLISILNQLLSIFKALFIFRYTNRIG